VDLRASLDDVKNRKFLTLPGLELRLLGRPACSQSLYRLSYPGSLIQLVPGDFSIEVKWPGRVAANSPLSSTEVKTVEAIPPLPYTSSWRVLELSTGTILP
jgi:hypothetical protein